MENVSEKRLIEWRDVALNSLLEKCSEADVMNEYRASIFINDVRALHTMYRLLNDQLERTPQISVKLGDMPVFDDFKEQLNKGENIGHCSECTKTDRHACIVHPEVSCSCCKKCSEECANNFKD